MDLRKILASFDAVENNTSASAVAKKKETGSILAILESFNRVENDETVEEAAKPDFPDLDNDGDTKEPMKKAIADKKKKSLVKESIKVGDTVKPTKGPHKGHPHEVIHDFGDGHYNVKPIGLSSKQIRYRLGAAKAHQSDLLKEEDVVKEAAGITVSDWQAIRNRKAKLVDAGIEPEEAQDQAAEEMGVDPEELADWLDANDGGDFEGAEETWDGKVVYPKIGDTVEVYHSDYTDGPEEEHKPNAIGKIVGKGDGGWVLRWRDHESGEIIEEEFSAFDEFKILNKDAEDPTRINESLEEAIMVSAEGDEAAQLLSILQLAGMQPPAPAAMPAPAMGPMEPDMGMEMQDEYSNSPDEFEQDIDSVIASGDDLHREKGQYAASAPGDNPMRAFEGKFKSILDELLAEDEKQ